MSDQRYRVAITADAASPDGSTDFGDIGLERLTDRGLEWQVLQQYLDPIPHQNLAGFRAVLSLGHTSFGADQVDQLPDLLHIARFGAGFESIDIAACTRAGVAVTNTPDGIRRPLALAALTLVLALAHSLPAKERIVRHGRWSERSQFRGLGVDGKILGIVGFGSVGADLAQLALGLGFTVIGTNRSGFNERADELGVPLVALDELMVAADYVVLTASLTADSRGMIDARRLAMMKSSAYLVNVGRGALVDEAALTTALREKQIAGAGLDVFDPEPVDPTAELVGFDSVILTPHSLPHTAEFTRDVSTSALDAILAIADARTPRYLINPEVLATDAWAAKRSRPAARG